jgi:hypothetical protein
VSNYEDALATMNFYNSEWFDAQFYSAEGKAEIARALTKAISPYIHNAPVLWQQIESGTNV